MSCGCVRVAWDVGPLELVTAERHVDEEIPPEQQGREETHTISTQSDEQAQMHTPIRVRCFATSPSIPSRPPSHLALM